MAASPALKYRAFLCSAYGDETAANWLFKRLQGYSLDADVASKAKLAGPRDETGRARLTPIYRTRYLSMGHKALPDSILSSLDSSASLIVLCSPMASGDRALGEAVRYFKHRYPDRPIIPVVPEGAIGSGLPPALRFALNADGTVGTQPISVSPIDLRESGDGRTFGVARVAAGLLGIDDVNALYRRDQARGAKTSQRIWTAGLAALALGFGGTAIWGETNRQEAARATTAAATQAKLVADQTLAFEAGKKEFEASKGMIQVAQAEVTASKAELDAARAALAASKAETDDLRKKLATKIQDASASTKTGGNQSALIASLQRDVALMRDAAGLDRRLIAQRAREVEGLNRSIGESKASYALLTRDSGSALASCSNQADSLRKALGNVNSAFLAYRNRPVAVAAVAAPVMASVDTGALEAATKQADTLRKALNDVNRAFLTYRLSTVAIPAVAVAAAPAAPSYPDLSGEVERLRGEAVSRDKVSNEKSAYIRALQKEVIDFRPFKKEADDLRSAVFSREKVSNDKSVYIRKLQAENKDALGVARQLRASLDEELLLTKRYKAEAKDANGVAAQLRVALDEEIARCRKTAPVVISSPLEAYSGYLSNAFVVAKQGPGDPEALHKLAHAHEGLARVRAAQGDTEGARTAYYAALATFNRIEEPARSDYHMVLSLITLHNEMAKFGDQPAAHAAEVARLQALPGAKPPARPVRPAVAPAIPGAKPALKPIRKRIIRKPAAAGTAAG